MPPQPRQYPTLTQTFLKGSSRGQIEAVYRAFRAGNEEKLADFQRALANGDCAFTPGTLSKELIGKCMAMQITVPPGALSVRRGPPH